MIDQQVDFTNRCYTALGHLIVLHTSASQTVYLLLIVDHITWSVQLYTYIYQKLNYGY